jgi:hypothetical protein
MPISMTQDNKTYREYNPHTGKWIVIMKTKILIIIILVLMSLNVYTLYEYNISSKNAACYAKKYQRASDGIKVLFQMDALKSLENLNLLLNNPDDLKLMLHANSYIYLEAIGNNDFSMFQKVDVNSTLCLSWTEDTKQQFKDIYLDITQLKDFNSSHTAMLEGLDIINNICLKEK